MNLRMGTVPGPLASCSASRARGLCTHCPLSQEGGRFLPGHSGSSPSSPSAPSLPVALGPPKGSLEPGT